jgi:tetratricopeptide (TPR) repeat protein
VGDVYWTVGAEAQIGWVSYFDGDLEAAKHHIEAAIASARDYPRSVAMCMSDLAQMSIELARHESDLDAVETGLAGHGAISAWAVEVVRAMRAFLAGRIGSGERLAQAALSIGPDPWMAGTFFGVQFLLAAYLSGRLADIAGALEHNAQAQPDQIGYRAALVLAYAELGRETEARFEFERFAAEDFATGATPQVSLMIYAFLAETCARLGDEDRAALLSEKLEPFAGRLVALGPGLCLGSVSRSLGLLATVVRRFDAAEQHFADALERNKAIGAKPFVALTQRDLARMLLVRGEPDDRSRAHDLLAAALETAQETGMNALASETLELLEHAALVTPEQPA